MVFLTSCNAETEQEITGEWTHGLGSRHTTNISHPGFLGSSLLIDKDSITIMNYPYSVLTRTNYTYENDSIYFTYIIPVKFSIEATDSTLILSGKNYLYGNEISECLTYQKGSFDPKTISMLHEVGYDKTELMKYNFCLQPPLNFEIHKSGISNWTTIDSMQSTLPRSIGFRDSSNIKVLDNSFQVENWKFDVVSFDPHVTRFMFDFGDSTISCDYYSICTEWAN